MRVCHCKRAVKPGIANHTWALVLRATQSLYYTHSPWNGSPKKGWREWAERMQPASSRKTLGEHCQGHGYSLDSVCRQRQLLALTSGVLASHL